MNVTLGHVRVKQMPPEKGLDTVNKDESHCGEEKQSFFSLPLTLQGILLGGMKKQLCESSVGWNSGKEVENKRYSAVIAGAPFIPC